jgi:hypothetical protein
VLLARPRPRPAPSTCRRLLLVLATTAVAMLVPLIPAQAAAPVPNGPRVPNVRLGPIRPSSTALAPTVLSVPSFSATADAERAIVVPPPVLSTLEPWSGRSLLMHQSTGTAPVVSMAMPGTQDGRALRLNLPARPSPGPRQGVTVASLYPSYRYGTYGSRMRSADCRGQDRPGVVTGTFVYSMDHTDANRNGLADNDEIDIEFLCAQPEVIWMTLWTDYDEARDLPRKISRAVNLRTGKVLTTCYSTTWTSPCTALLPGENTPATVAAVPAFNSATTFRSYTFDWQPNRVTFQTIDDLGRKIVLWDYRGPTSRIPQKPATFMQNIWHTRNWDPPNGPSHNQPTADTSAYLDSTVLPQVPLR